MTLLIGLLLLGLLMSLLALFSLSVKSKKPHIPSVWPEISIWVAARNEEAHILACLNSLARIDYPLSHIQILIGDDESEDATRSIIEDFIKDKPHFSCLSITGQLGKADKKANVLAHLAHASTGDFYLVCDADIQVKPTWAKEMVQNFDSITGIVSATTLIDNGSWFARMQRIDWLYFMGLIKSAANLGIPCTAVGNNMAVRKEAYWATGGYENIDFSITEDFKLFREIIQRDYAWKHLFNAASASVSAPVPDFKTLLSQRKRWLEGGKELPPYWKVIMLLYASFNPALLILVFFHPLLALIFLMMRLSLQFVYIHFLLLRVKAPFMVVSFLSYIGYNLFISAASAIGFFLPRGKEWKGRKYS